jgi:hypothetical protein
LGSVAPNYNDLSVFKSTVKSVADSQKQFARDRVLDVYQVNQRNMPFDVARTLAPTEPLPPPTKQQVIGQPNGSNQKVPKYDLQTGKWIF